MIFTLIYFDAVNPQNVAAFQEQRLFNTVQHPGLNSSNNLAGWHGNRNLYVKQQLILRHYSHHAPAAGSLDHVRTNHATSTNQKRHVHVSTNQQPALKRQPNTEFSDQISPSFSAPFGGHQQRPQAHRWMSQPSDAERNEKPASSRLGLQELR